MNASVKPPWLQRTLSLRWQVAFVIGILSLVPGFILVLALFLVATSSAETARLVRQPVFWWLLPVVPLSALTGYLVSRRLLAPLIRLTKEVQQLKGLTDHRPSLTLEPGEPGEVLSLRQAFSDLLWRVALEQSRRRAFMATLVHDLKTPLIAANHVLQGVRDNEQLDKARRVAVLTQLIKENETLIALVQKLVDANKYEREVLTLNRQEVALRDLIEAVFARVAPLAQSKDINLSLEGEARASVDPVELERALYNLISNAVRYARSRIGVELYAGMIRLVDDGPGLPAPLGTLAQPFGQRPVHIAGREYAAGTAGLGLFISRRIIEAHGGQLVTEVTSPKGTIFLIYLGS